MPTSKSRTAYKRAWKRARKMRLRTELQNEANALAAKLSALGEEHPTFRGELNRLVYAVRKRGVRTPKQVRLRVSRAVWLQGCRTLREVRDETKLQAAEVEGALALMEAEGAVEVRRDGARVLYYPVERRARSS